MLRKFQLLIALCVLGSLSQSCSQGSSVAVVEQIEEAPYQERYRPQFHFSPPHMWMNDPNGMVYYQGEYHLFYQHYPDSNVWGPMHWAHAVSTNLVHWEHLPIALYPDSLGYIFSGSAVVDWENTTGFGSQENPPLVAIYTYHDPVGAEEERNDFQYQAIAYSLDKGRSWTKYQGNPVVENPGIRDFRDPKVIWHEPSQKWVMVFAAFDHVKFYTSTDLKAWEWTSDFGLDQGSHGGVWECPDLFPLKVEGTDETNWVLIVSLGNGNPNGGSGTQYFIGDFDGTKFTNSNPSDEVLWLDYGKDNYAGVTWSDVPEEDGRRIFIGWMSNWQYAQQVPTYHWRSAMTLPRELKLKHTDAGTRMVSVPVTEIQELYLESQTIEEQSLTDSQPLTLDLSLDASLSLIELEVTPEKGSEFSIEIGNGINQQVEMTYNSNENRYYIDRTSSGKTDFSPEFAGIHDAPRISDEQNVNLSIYVDRSSLEVFADQGEVVITELVFPDENYDRITLHSTGGVTQIQSGKITGMKSVW